MSSHCRFVAHSTFLADYPLRTFAKLTISTTPVHGTLTYSSDIPYNAFMYAFSNTIIPTITDVLISGRLSSIDAAEHQ